MDKYLTIPEALSIAQVDENLLNNLCNSGKIRTTMLSTSGITLVNETDLLNQIPREQREEYKKYSHMAGHGISMRQASQQYDIPHQTISRWVKRGYIKTLGQNGRAVLIDAADMAYCAEIYQTNPGQGKWIFETDGKPYTKKAI